MHKKTYRINNTHSDLFSIICYVRIQGHKDRDTTIIYKSYDNDMAYILALLTYKAALYNQTTPVH